MQGRQRPKRRHSPGWLDPMNILIASLVFVLCLMIYMNVSMMGMNQDESSTLHSKKWSQSFRQAPDSAKALNSRRTIVLIANYRDTKRCSETLNSIFSQADHPELISVSIFDQLNFDENEKRCFDAYCDLVGEDKCRRSERLRRNDTVSCKDAKGPTYGRYQTEEGVDLSIDTFALAIDSHLIFIPHWDTDLISQWDATGNLKAIITVYPDATEQMPKNGEKPTGTILLCHGRIENAQPDSMVQYSSAVRINSPDKPMLMSQFAGGFNFGSAQSALEVRNDPYAHYLFHGEEYSRVARLWTSGYDTYIPTHMLCYHWYEKRKGMWDEDWGAKTVIARRSQRRIRAALGLVPTLDDYDRTDLHKFTLGTKRSFEQFKKFSGIDPDASWIEDNEHQFDVCPPKELKYVPYLEEPAKIPTFTPPKQVPALTTLPVTQTTTTAVQNPPTAAAVQNLPTTAAVKTTLVNVPATRDPVNRRIIVLIANYRDSQRCGETLRSMYSNATHPELISVSIFDQLNFDEGEKPCFDVYCSLVSDCRRSERLRRNASISYLNATGPTYGRYQTEEGIDLNIDTFAMAIDSHIIFIPNWDADLLSQWDSIGNPKAIITVYPDSTELYPKPGDVQTGVTLMCHARIESKEKDAMVQYSWAITVPCPQKPQLMSQFAGGFNFGSAESALEVRNDPYTPYLFHGEEYSRIARLFTHGYDTYIPTHMVCYHYYETRKAIWDQDWGKKLMIAKQSKRRVRAALGLKPSNDDYDKTDLAKFSIGTKRTMEQFRAFSGINPDASWIEDNEGQFDVCPPKELKYVPYEGSPVETPPPTLAPLLEVPTKPRTRDPVNRRTIVLIANYRDTKRCSETIQSIYTQADHPELISVSIFDQLNFDENEKRCFDAYCDLVGEENCHRSERLRRNDTISYKDAKGPTYGRYQTEEGVDLSIDTFAMAIDSHLIFIPHWDTDLISQWDAIKNPKGIITVYPDATEQMPKNGQKPTGTILLCHARIQYNQSDSMVQYSSAVRIDSPEKPMLMSQFAGGFNFGSAESALEVRNDPYAHYLFHGEEYSRVARLWTSGYDTYIPTHMLCYHWYEKRKGMWDEDWHIKEVIARRSQRRIRAALGLVPTIDDYDKTELHKFSLGTKRTFEQFKKFTGIDPDASWIEDNEHQFDVCPPKQLKYVPYEGSPVETPAVTVREAVAPTLPRTRDTVNRHILTMIANYRDSTRCAETLESLFSKAARPELVTVSIFDQLSLEEGEKPCFDVYCEKIGEANCKRAERLRRNATISYKDAKGPTYGRHQTEEGIDKTIDTFAMAIDAHLIFIDNWDTDIVSQWDSIENPKAVITVYPDHTDMFPKNGKQAEDVLLMCHARIENNGDDAMVQYSSVIRIPCPTKPQLMSQFAGGFNFGTVEYALDIRNDPYTPFLFHGEEYSRAARLFTHGYDTYIPKHMIAYHYYEKRKVFWDENWDVKYLVAKSSQRRIRAALGLPTTVNDYDKTDLEKYSIGKVRTMEQFKAFSGIDPTAAFMEGKNEAQFDVCPPKVLEYVPYEGSPAKLASPAPQAVAAPTIPRTRDPINRHIIVLIANYRDTKRCSETLESIYTQADHPELIAVSIFDQLNFDENEKRCFDAYCDLVGEDKCRRSERLRRNDTISYKDAKGPTYGRYQTEEGVDLSIDTFAMAIDSHLIFIPHWDTDLVSQWDTIGNPKAIITVYPDATEQMPKNGQKPTGTILLCHGRIENNQPDSMVQYSSAVRMDSPEKPMLMSQFAGGFNFGSAESALEVRNDPYAHYLFHGEEYSRVARLWTSGYDTYIPTHMLCYHWYEKRKGMWDEDWGAKTIIAKRSQRRIRASLGLVPSNDDYDKTDLDKFTLGTKRTFEQFKQFSGINPDASWIEDNEHQFDVCPPKELKYVPPKEDA
ncbi:unnamed protein product [Aphanomyces euteiches]